MRIAFLGLGRMGSAMALNVLRAGHQLTVYNRSRAKAESLAAQGASVAESPAAAARDCDAAITMLADDDTVEEVVFGTQGLAEGLRQGAIHIGCSTISTAMARRLAEEHADRGQRYVSAPVFGRPEAAEAKKLVIVPAGPRDAIAEARPMLEAVSRQVLVAGKDPWQANAVKLCGNFMIASAIESFSEAFAILRKAGVPADLFLEVANSIIASPVFSIYGELIAKEQFDPAGFELKLGLKDVQLMLEISRELAAPMPFASILRDRFLSGMAHGQETLDWSSVARVAARDAGL